MSSDGNSQLSDIHATQPQKTDRPLDWSGLFQRTLLILPAPWLQRRMTGQAGVWMICLSVFVSFLNVKKRLYVKI